MGVVSTSAYLFSPGARSYNVQCPYPQVVFSANGSSQIRDSYPRLYIPRAFYLRCRACCVALVCLMQRGPPLSTSRSP